MSARLARAAVVTATVLLAGLILGLSLGTAQDTGTSDGPAAGAGTGAGASEPAVSVPEDQTNLVDEQAVTTVDPAVPTKGVPAQTATDSPKSLSTTTTTDALGQIKTVTLKPAPVSGRAVGSAHLATQTVKAREAEASCAAHPPGTSSLLSVGSESSGDPHRSLTWLFLGIAVAAGAVAVGAIAWRRRRERHSAPGREGADAKREPPKPKTPLEIASSLVAILGTFATLAVVYLGTGVKDRPPPTIKMKVREVHSRITHGVYAKQMGAPGKVHGLDRREIGNVVWLEMRFTGYRGAHLLLQTSAFKAGPGQPFIPYSVKTVRIHVDDRSDLHTEFRPIWVGSPRVPRFRAEFRIIDDGQVRQIASTGPMKGITYRYTC